MIVVVASSLSCARFWSARQEEGCNGNGGGPPSFRVCSFGPHDS